MYNAKAMDPVATTWLQDDVERDGSMDPVATAWLQDDVGRVAVPG